jgi:hypothetical protein
MVDRLEDTDRPAGPPRAMLSELPAPAYNPTPPGAWREDGMAESKGKFISLAGALMSLYEDKLEAADRYCVRVTGKHYNDLDPEGWYGTDVINAFMEKYCEGSPTGERAIITLGRKIYPRIKRTVGLPEFKSPLEAIIFEAEGFLDNHRGSDVVPRKFLRKEEGLVIVEAPAPGYDCLLYEGVYLGILEMTGVATGTCKQTRCVKKGDPTCEFRIEW